MNSKKPTTGPFLTHFCQFLGKMLSSKNLVLSRKKLIWVSNTMPKFRNNDSAPRKCLDNRQTNWQTEDTFLKDPSG